MQRVPSYLGDSWISLTVALAIFSGGSVVQAAEFSNTQARLEEALGDLQSPDSFIRQRAFLRLEALRDPSSIDAIRSHLNDKDADTRAFSLRALAAVQGASAIPTLLNALQKDPNPTARRAALFGLEPLQEHDPTILPAFIQALKDRKPEVRIVAVDVVSRIDKPQAKQALLERKHREHNHDVRRVLTQALVRAGA